MNTPDANENIEPRTTCALTEYMIVLLEGNEIYTITGQNGCTYTVDRREERCTCPDAKQRSATCKHQRRVAFATGEHPIPTGLEGVDGPPGEHSEVIPPIVASDGDIIEACDDVEILEGDADERPEDCSCRHDDAGRQCWPCYRDGFHKPSPAADSER